MSNLLKLTAVIEAATGLGLVALPSVVVRPLLGSPLDSSAATMLGRVAGVALLALAVACWLARDDTRSRGGPGTGRGHVPLQRRRRRAPRLRRCWFGIARHRAVAGRDSPRGYGRLVCPVPLVRSQTHLTINSRTN
jgi:hypothetical protein